MSLTETVRSLVFTRATPARFAYQPLLTLWRNLTKFFFREKCNEIARSLTLTKCLHPFIERTITEPKQNVKQQRVDHFIRLKSCDNILQ